MVLELKGSSKKKKKWKLSKEAKSEKTSLILVEDVSKLSVKQCIFANGKSNSNSTTF